MILSLKIAALVASLGVIAAVAIAAPDGAKPAAPKSPLDFTVKDIDGKEVALSKYRGDVVLIVNTASLCGYTPQYASLEKLYEKYEKKGLRILAFPANDFGHQEPGKEAEIKTFCTTRYNTKFDLFSKVATRGEEQAPLYKFLTSPETNGKYAGPIKWNFTKFLVNRKGQIVARYDSAIDPMSTDVTNKVEAELEASAKSAETKTEAPAGEATK